MKLIQFAIASIVDANTGYGYSGHGKIDYAAAERHGNSIRSRSIIDSFALLKTRIGAGIEGFGLRLEHRRQLQALEALNDHLLRDIGLSRGDLLSVKLGHTSLDALKAERLARNLHTQATSRVKIDAGRSAAAANQEDYAESQCA